MAVAAYDRGWAERTEEIAPVEGTPYMCRKVVELKQYQGLVARVVLHEVTHQLHFQVTLEVFPEAEMSEGRPTHYLFYAGFHYKGQDCLATAAQRGCNLTELADKILANPDYIDTLRMK